MALTTAPHDTARPFDRDMPPSLCMLTSVSDADSLSDIRCPVLLCDTDNTENAVLLCRTARARGCCVTVLLTADGDFPCERLLVPADRYDTYRDAAPTVGVRFAYDVRNPDIVSHIRRFADLGITLIDAYPINPGDRKEGEQQPLINALHAAAEELCQRKVPGQTVEFLPFSVMGHGAKHGIGAHRNARCPECSHNTVCGGRRLSFADCEIKKVLADCAVRIASAAESSEETP